MDQLRRLSLTKNIQKFDKKIVDKQFLLGKFYDSIAPPFSSCSHPSKSACHKKFQKSKTKKLLDAQIKIFDQLKSDVNHQDKKQSKNKQYSFYTPLNKLWIDYITDLIAKQPNQQSKQLKLLRSDFHGALITVVSSKNASLQGLTGIVIKQTLRTFQIVVKYQQKPQLNDKQMTRVVLKPICIFLVQVGDKYNFILNGNSLIYRPSDRIKHKFKFKKAQKLNHQFIQILNDSVLQANSQ